MPPSWAGGTLGPGLVPRSAGSCLLSTVLKQLLVHLSRCCEGCSRRSPGEGEFAIRPGTGTSVRCLFAFKSPKSACLLMIEVFFFFFYLRGNLRDFRPVPGVPVFRSPSVHFRPSRRARGGSFPLVNVRPPFWEKFSNRSVDKFPPRRQPPSGRLRLAVSASDPRAHPLPLSLTVSLFVLLLWFPHYFPSALFSGLSMQFVICALAILIPKGSFCCRPLRFCCCCFFK